MNLERDFAAWADRRDPDALTRVFDATAGRLLLLAAHIAGRAGSAEDLVQATFLAAMARSTTWDRTRPVWPWLATILHNEARMQWRRQGRRREEGLDAAGQATANEPDPALLAASEETFAAVVQAIDRLPVAYRQVLRLRLLHGLQHIEIARVLELPIGTVRAQTHRGLAHLREVLPAGVAVAVAAWLTGDGALLAQVRDHVLAHAAATGAAAVATSKLLLTGGWWAMHGKTVGLIAAGCVLLLCLGLALGLPPGSDATQPAHTPAAPVAINLIASGEQPATDVESPPERSAAEVGTAPAWPLVVTVKTTAGQAIAGATVRVWIAARGLMIANATQGDVGRQEIASGLTAADGTFECALDTMRRQSALFRTTNFVFFAATSGRREATECVLGLPRTATPQAFAAELTIDTEGINMFGRVVDGNGKPVDRVSLYALLEPAHDWSPMGDRYGDLRLHEDGSFAVNLRPGDEGSFRGRIAAVHAGLGVAVATLPEANGDTIEIGTLVLDGKNAIRGQVVLGDGSPLGAFPVFVRPIDAAIADDPVAIRRAFWQQDSHRQDALVTRNGLPQQTQPRPITDADGSFVCAGLDPEATYAIMVRDASLATAAVAVAHVGGEPMRLVVDRQLLLLDVQDEQGSPLPGARIYGQGFNPARQTPTDRSRPGFPTSGYAVGNPPFAVDEAGRLMLLSPFGWIWRLGMSDESVHPEVQRHEVFAGVYRAQCTLVLRPETQFGSLHLVVVDEHGDVLPGRNAKGQLMYETDLRCPDRDLQRNGRRAYPPDDGIYRDLPAGNWHLQVFVGQQTHFPLDAYARGMHERDVVIADGRTTEVTIVAPATGLVGLRLHSQTPPDDQVWQDVKVQADGDEADVGFHVYADGRPNWGLQPSHYGALFLVKSSFPPGRHTFVITAKGYHPARAELTVNADQVVEARVELFRQ